MTIEATFDPTLHPRTESGKFTESHGSAPESGLAAQPSATHERARILDALDGLASAHRAYERRHGVGLFEHPRDYEDFEDARLAFADEAEAVFRDRIAAGTATPEVAKLVDDLDRGRSGWEPGESTRDDEAVEDGALAFADDAEAILQDEAMPVLTLGPTSTAEERHAAVKATFPWADDDAAAAIAKGESRQRATPAPDWFEEPDEPVLCQNCGKDLVSNFEGSGRWGHAGHDDAACYDREWHASVGVASAVTAVRDRAEHPALGGRLRDYALDRIREAGTR